jgi:hypothetical protein
MLITIHPELENNVSGPHIVMRAVVRAHAAPGTEPRIKSIVNVYDYYRTTTGGVPTKAQFATAFAAHPATDIQGLLSVSYITDFLDVRFLDDPLDPFLTAALAKNGTVAADSLPSVNNVTLQLKTGLRGPSYRGSKHFGPIAESDTTLDGLTAGAITRWATFQTAYLAGFTDAGGFLWLPVVTSQKYSTFTLLTAIVVYTAVNATIVNPYLGIMRRRKE